MTTESKPTRKAQLLTVKGIEAMEPDPSGAYRVPDTRAKGLALRVATDGGKTWDSRLPDQRQGRQAAFSGPL
jgi:hypothetical protein